MNRIDVIAIASGACGVLLTTNAAQADLFYENIFFASDMVYASAYPFNCASTQTNATATAQLIQSVSGGVPSKILTTEANNCRDSSASYTSTFVSKWRNYVSGYPLWPVPGNHDYFTSSGGDDHLATAFRAYFSVGSNPTYTSYTLGDHWLVVGLDSELDTLTSPTMQQQRDWLTNLLNANTRPCILAYSHRPAYSNAKKHHSEHLDSQLVATLNTKRATLLLSGHEHVYERLAPTANGMIQVVAGTGGAPLNSSPAFLSSGEAGYVASAFQTNSVYGVVQLTVWDYGGPGWPPGYWLTFWGTDFQEDNYTASCNY